MKLIPSTLADIPSIMSIIKDAQEYLAELKIDQWQDGYPTEDQIKLDIANNDSYVVLNDSGKIIGTTVFSTKKEPSYSNIEGKWITPGNANYGVIHRLAVCKNSRKSGMAKFVFDECEQQLKKLEIGMRIDTHRDNKGMQRLLKARGYQYCGVIYLESGAERLAFEKLCKSE